MKQKESPELSDQAAIEKAKKEKSNALLTAGLIGFMIGIIIYSAAKNSLGFFTLIPLYIVYRLINQPKK